jgi:hypothetical protein
MVGSTVDHKGTTIALRHPRLDKGEIADAFDGDTQSLARTLDSNPARLEFSFPDTRPVSGIRLHLWTDHYTVEITARRKDGTEVVASSRARGSEFGPAIEVHFPEPVTDVALLTVVIRKIGDVHMHLREVEIVP